MAKITLDNLAHSYLPNPTSEDDFALKELNHDWVDGEAYALLGASGCGKSTLLNIISGLLHPSQGRILFNDRDVTNDPTTKRNIAQVFQFPVVYDTMTVRDNLAFPLRNRGADAAYVAQRVQQIAGMIGMEDMLTARAETEAVCCRLAARARTTEDLAALRAELALQRDPTLRDEEFCASDLRFHRALVQATHNPPLKLMMYAVIESFIPVTNMLIYRDHERRLSVDLHEAITDAVAAGDGPRAAELMARHLEGMRGLLTATLDRRAAGPAV